MPVLKGNETLVDVRDTLKLCLVPSRHSWGSFDPHHALPLQFSHLLILFIPIKPPAPAAAPTKGSFQALTELEVVMETQINTSAALDLLQVCGRGRSSRDRTLHQYLCVTAESWPCRRLQLALKAWSKLITTRAPLHHNLTAFYGFVLDPSSSAPKAVMSCQ